MKKLVIALTFVMTSAFAQDSRDIVLPGAKWFAKHTGFVCAAFSPVVQAPSELAALNVKFERIVTDSSLDNGLITATFTEGERSCRYNAVVFADNAASTMRLVESKAYDLTDSSECAEGRAVLDSAFESNDYLYYGHPHNLAVMIPSTGAEEICGAGAKYIGVNFVVGGKL